jgi:hypothetical protein
VVNVFAGLNEHRLAIEAGREFRQRFPDSPKYVEVSLRLADSYVALKDRVNERAVLAELLDRLAKATPKGVPLAPVAAKDGDAISPKLENLIDRIEYNIEAYGDAEASTESEASSEDSGESGNETTSESEASESNTDTAGNTETAHAPSYSSVLERYVSSLAAEDKKTETVAFFWAQIRKHPSSEGLYERFLSWLGSAELVNEQLKAYNSAIRRFDSGPWYQRLARWYIRQKRGRELGRYSHQLIDIFNEEEITDYLLGLEASGAKAAGDDVDWDQQLSFDLYSYARTHFPRNLFFVRGMLKYYEEHDRARWEKLSAQYYFAARSIREPYLAWLSKQGQLRDKYAEATRRVSVAAGIKTSSAPPATDSVEGSPHAGQASTDGTALTPTESSRPMLPPGFHTTTRRLRCTATWSQVIRERRSMPSGSAASRARSASRTNRSTTSRPPYTPTWRRSIRQNMHTGSRPGRHTPSEASSSARASNGIN